MTNIYVVLTTEQMLARIEAEAPALPAAEADTPLGEPLKNRFGGVRGTDGGSFDGTNPWRSPAT